MPIALADSVICHYSLAYFPVPIQLKKLDSLAHFGLLAAVRRAYLASVVKNDFGYVFVLI